MGVIPWELEHVHPAQQCIFSNDIDQETLRVAEARLKEVLGSISYKRIIWFDRESPVTGLKETFEDSKSFIASSSKRA